MKKIISISHIDLDGFTCSYLVNKFCSSTATIEYYNVDYSELKDSLEFILSNLVPLRVGVSLEILITDLNLDVKCIEVIEKYRSKFTKLTLIDHHNNDISRLDVMGHLLEDDGVDVTINIEKGISATKLVLNNFKDNELPEDEELSQLVTLVNAWDVHDFSNQMTFSQGQLLNDIFYMVSKIFKPVVSKNVYAEVMCSLIHTFHIEANLHPEISPKNLEIDILNILALDLYGTLSLKYPISDTKLETSISTAIDNLGVTQGLSALAAYMSTQGTGEDRCKSMDYIHSGDEVYSVAIPTTILPMPVIHHLLYTLKIYNAVCVLNTDRMVVEMRQRDDLDNSVDLSKIAREHGGGGHKCASGFPLRSKHDWDCRDLRVKLFDDFDTQLNTAKELENENA